MVYAQLASDGACTRLKNQHLILSCLLRIYWIFYLAFHLPFFCLSPFLPSINCTTGCVCVGPGKIFEERYEEKTLIIDEGTTEM
jgi:hypothetical protein